MRSITRTLAPTRTRTLVVAILVGLSAITALGPDPTAAQAPASGATILPVQCSIYDSGSATGPFAGPIPAGSTRTLQVSGPIPADQRFGGGSCIDSVSEATSAILLVTARIPSGAGNLRVSPAGVAPSGGVVNYTSNGLTNANTVTVPLSADGRIDVSANASSTDVGITVLGFYGPTGTLDFAPLTPCAALDTRTGVGAFAGPAGADDFFLPDVVGFFSPDQGTGVTDCGVPAGAHSIMANLVAIRPPGGYGGAKSFEATSVSIFPGRGMTWFAELNLNNATAVVVPLDGDERVKVSLLARRTPEMAHARLVILGYFTEDEAEQYTPVTPCAAFDSRSGSGSFAGKRSDGSGGVTTYDVTGTMPAAQGAQTDCGVPDGVGAVLINLVAIQPDAVGNFRAYASGSTPNGGVLNFAPLTPAMNNSNAVVVPVSAAGSLDLFVNAPSAAGGPAVHARGVILGYYD